MELLFGSTKLANVCPSENKNKDFREFRSIDGTCQLVVFDPEMSRRSDQISTYQHTRLGQ